MERLDRMLNVLFFISILSLVPNFVFCLDFYNRINFFKQQDASLVCSGFQEYYFAQKVDHFNIYNDDNYKQRVLINRSYWREGGPIFFYTGNEGDIYLFCNNTGFMRDIAPEFGALLIFAEHRYYGKSIPYGPSSFSDPSKLGPFTSEQALADYAVLINNLKATLSGAEKSPVIAFGGSYGGMLAAWFRMKYPNIVVGAIAGSAPIWQFPNITACGAYNEIVTRDFKISGKGCDETIRKSWNVFNSIGRSLEGLQNISNAFHLCNQMKSVHDLNGFKNWLTNAWGTVAMVDYPYPTSFLGPLPAWPVKVICSKLQPQPQTNEQYLRQIYEAVNVFYNYTGSASCFNISNSDSPGLDTNGWYYQTCTEMVMPMCADGVHDMFEYQPWNFVSYTEDCIKTWSTKPREHWIEIQYGGLDITAASNIVFSNGELDPWSGGGVRKSLSSSLIAVLIENGAHHLDLRSSNPADPPSVIAARMTHKLNIKKWISDWRN